MSEEKSDRGFISGEGGVVFMDSSSLGDLSSPLTQQELENFVGLNLNASDIESLPESEIQHTDDGVVLCDGVSVSNIVEISEAGPSSSAGNNLSNRNNIEQFSKHVIGDLMLNENGEILSIKSENFVDSDTTFYTSCGTSEITETPSQAENQLIRDSSGNQILSTSMGQFIILPQTQNEVVTEMPKNVISSGSTFTVAGNKTLYITPSQVINSCLANSKVVTQSKQPQFRTLQLKPAQGNSLQPQKTGQIIVQRMNTGAGATAIKGATTKFMIPMTLKSPSKVTNPVQVSGQQNQLVSNTGQIIRIPISQISNQSSNLQFLQNKVSYVRVINHTVPTENSATNIISSAATKPVVPATSLPLKIKALPLNTGQNVIKHRLLVPSQTPKSTTAFTVKQPENAIALPASALTSTALANAQPGSVVVIPAQYVAQNVTTSVAGNNSNVSFSNASKNDSPLASAKPAKTVIDSNGIKPRKPCNCTKSQCLKLYCDCFANGEFCNNCNCNSCYNNLIHEEERQKAIKACLERNPMAFRPKIGKGGSDSERRHNKGCNCKRSGCLKNYCECYEAKIPCTLICKCIGCKNVDFTPIQERKPLLQLAECAEARVNQQLAFKSKPLSYTHPSPIKFGFSSSKSGFCRISQEVVEATCQCLLAQADKGEKNKLSRSSLERMVIAEFSRCLMQIIESCSTRTRG